MKAREIGAYDAKTRLSQILEKVRRGQTFFITRRGRRIAELRPVLRNEGRLSFGCDKGRVFVGDDFDAPIPGFGPYSS